MNLKQLLKKMVAIKDQQQTINKKFSSRGKTAYIHQADLKKDQQEDIRIFGFTNAQTIHYFRNKFQVSSAKLKAKYTQTQNSIKNQLDKKQIEGIFKTRNRTVQEKRRKMVATVSLKRPQTFNASAKNSQSRVKYLNSPLQRRSALTFYKSSKSTVASDTIKFQKTTATDEFQGKQSYNSFMVCKKTDPNQHKKSVTSLHSRKSIDLYREQFTRQFLINVKHLNYKNREQTNKFKARTIIYDDKRESESKKLLKKSKICKFSNQNNYSQGYKKKDHTSNIFELTSDIQSYCQPENFKQKLNLKEDLALLRKISPLLIQKTINMIPINRRLCGVHRWLPVWRHDIFSGIKGKFSILIVQAKSLKSLLIENVQKNKLGLVSEIFGQLNLQEIIKSILKINIGNFVHFIAFQGNHLVHEQFLINGDLYVRQTKHHQSLIAQYFLKRYLCQDLSVDSIDQVLRNSQTIIRDDHNIPEQFEQFVSNFPQRVVYFYDRKSKLLQCFLNKVLYSGLQQIHCKITISKETTKGLTKIPSRGTFSASYYNSHNFYI